ncbi:MAG: response regulator transcription factor, partial [Candidatus Obscuribacterales bacterium]|nr:response regulator transcription factor [Candidatus Obscuribacterales bacterium]
MAKILIGETQEDLAIAMKEYFSRDHFTVYQERSGWGILECLRRHQYDVIILEMALLGLDAISVVRSFRAAGGSTPIVMIGTRQEELQCVLDAGADSYVVKPFQLADLSAQLRAVLRRPALLNERVLRVGEIEMNLQAGTVSKNDIEIHLHPMEYKLLHFLMSHEDQVFNAHALFERVWQKGSLLEDTVRTHVRTLRQKIDKVGSPSIITTVR